MKCDKLQSYKGDVTIPVYGTIADADVYLKEDADKAIAELQSENAELKKKLMPCLNGDCILTCEVVEKYGKENAELKAKLDKAIAERDGNQVCIDALKQKLEDVQASAYAESVDAGMRERRLHRALYKACANWAKVRQRAGYFSWTLWGKMKDKCLNKMEEYK